MISGVHPEQTPLYGLTRDREARMAQLYPPIEPYEHGLMDVGHGHQVYWEECGNPEGKPALVIHGGPGSGATPGWRRYFDPDRYL
jgi:proline iminopeptidase